jgi:tetratricopeptide (TPR) repeat protein
MPDCSDVEQKAHENGILPLWLFGGWLLMAALSWLWGRAPNAFEGIRKLGVNVLVIGPILLVIYMVQLAVREDLMIVDAFSVPKSLEDQGYTGRNIAQRVIDEVKLIHATAWSRVDRQKIGHESQFASLSNLQVPQAGLTLQTVVDLLRKVFRSPDDRIGGEIAIKQEARGLMDPVYVISVRFDISRHTPERLGRPTDSRHFVKAFDKGTVDELVEQAAQMIVEKTDPATLASYLYQARKWKELDTLLDQLVESSRPKIAARALILRGVRLGDQCRFDEAWRYFEDAIQLTHRDTQSRRKGRFAMIKYGDALTKAGWVEEAIEIFERASKLEAKSNSQLYGSWAKALSERDGLAAADEKLRAAERESRADKNQGGRDARLYRIWGDILHKHDQRKPATDKYRIAIALDPQEALAYQGWGRILLESDEDDDLTIAIEKLRIAVAKDKRLPGAHYYLGQALLRQGDVVAAVEAFESAAKVASAHQAKAWTKMSADLLKVPDPMRLVKELAPTECLSDPNKRPILPPEPEPVYLTYHFM